jgi:NAD(P)H-dependent FMN reductase
MTQIIALSGSLREASFNTALIRAAAEMFPNEVAVASIEGIPLYNEDDEKSDGIPANVTELKDRIANADGLLIATPEYNNSIPGVVKNAIDWLSRPADDIPRVFHGRPVAIMGASPGGFGTNLAQNAWLPVLRTLKTRPWFEGRLMVSRASTLVDDKGALTDEATREKLEKFVSGFIDFCGST